MKRNSLKYTTSSLIAAGALLVSGNAFGADANTSQTRDDNYGHSPTATQNQAEQQRELDRADAPESDRAGQAVTQQRETRDTTLREMNDRQREYGDSKVQSDHRDHDHKQQADRWNGEKTDHATHAQRGDVKTFEGRVVSASEFLQDRSDDSTQPAMRDRQADPNDTRLFVTEDNEAYLLIESDQADRRAMANADDAQERNQELMNEAREDNAQNRNGSAKLSQLRDDSMVRIKGQTVERAGLKAIMIQSIEKQDRSADRDSRSNDQQSRID